MVLISKFLSNKKTGPLCVTKKGRAKKHVREER